MDSSKKAMDRFRDFVAAIAEVDDKDWQFFSSRLVRREFSKKTIFLDAGQIENHISFIEKGAVRLLIPKEEEEKEITFGFSFENEFVSAYDSFLTQRPSVYQLEALVDTVVWSISHEDLQAVYKETHIGNTIGRFTADA